MVSFVHPVEKLIQSSREDFGRRIADFLGVFGHQLFLQQAHVAGEHAE